MANELLKNADGDPVPQVLADGATISATDLTSGDTSQWAIFDDPASDTTLTAVRDALQALDDALASNGTDQVRTDITSISSPSTIESGQKTVSSAGTAEALVGTSTPISEGVTIKALAGNGGTVYVGDSGVSASAGFELASGERVFVVVDDLSTVHIDVDTGGEGVSFIAS